MSRLGLEPFIFVIYKEGYTIERFIHAMDEADNDIQPWYFKDLVNVFDKGADQQAFEEKEFNSANVLQFVELYMPKKDVPRAFMLTADASAENNPKQ
ncbi:pyruvate decarboxylase [Stipitochalara longipes BDJ]|nr:pyruvate decarboxylase [Stipitochalara longipes BDJ]